MTDKEHSRSERYWGEQGPQHVLWGVDGPYAPSRVYAGTDDAPTPQTSTQHLWAMMGEDMEQEAVEMDDEEALAEHGKAARQYRADRVADTRARRGEAAGVPGLKPGRARGGELRGAKKPWQKVLGNALGYVTAIGFLALIITAAIVGIVLLWRLIL